jgi:hypothetical protein
MAGLAWQRRMVVLAATDAGTVLQWHRPLGGRLSRASSGMLPGSSRVPEADPDGGPGVSSEATPAGLLRLERGTTAALSGGKLVVRASDGGRQLVLRAPPRSVPGELVAWEREIAREIAAASQLLR